MQDIKLTTEKNAPASRAISMARLPIPVIGNSFFGPLKPVPARIPEDFFFSVFFCWMQACTDGQTDRWMN